MNILVLGSHGIIGSGLCTHLRACGHTVIPWDIKINQTHDLSDSTHVDTLREIVDTVDFVFFLAYDIGGSKYIQKSGIDFINNNVRIMLHTFNEIKNKKFIFASSTMYNMSHVYGRLKSLGEHYTSELGGLSVRFWNVYGPEESSEKSHVIADMIHKWKMNGHIDLMTSGEEERQFLHTDDCAKALTQLMENYDEVIKTETSVDVTSFTWMKIKDVANFICDDVRVTDIKVTTHDRKNEPRVFILKYWKPSISLRSGIASLQSDYPNYTPSSSQYLPT
jgi:nucleoside-diphosphate-sugar epimerase